LQDPESPGVSLAAAQRACNTAAATDIAEAALAGTGWVLEDIYRYSVRLDPELGWWAVYRVRVERPTTSAKKEPERRKLTLVGRVCFDTEDWHEYRDWLRDLYDDAPCRPIGGLGFPVIVEEHQQAWWFYPVDPHLQTLADATDPRTVRPLLAPRYSAKTTPARITVEAVRYHPETSAALRYTVVDRPGAEPRGFFGKVYREGRGRELHTVTEQLWALSQARPDLLSVPEPVAYDEELELHLEKAAPGEPVEGERTHPRFHGAALAAAEALAALHDSDMEIDETLPLGPELDRLDEVTEQMLGVHPPAGQLLRDLVVRIRERLASTPAEDEVVTHGDMKYDQFLEHEGRFTLVDFEEVGRGETSWDLGKWCAHCVPSMPETWEDSDAAERARTAFLARYRELRPQAGLGRFPLYEATHLGNRAMILMWGHGEGWEQAAESLLSLAMERLQAPPP
jgi:aminoglycoside phosphotransferase (APT) family kinase protein